MSEATSQHDSLWDVLCELYTSVRTKRVKPSPYRNGNVQVILMSPLELGDGYRNVEIAAGTTVAFYYDPSATVSPEQQTCCTFFDTENQRQVNVKRSGRLVVRAAPVNAELAARNQASGHG